MSNKPINKLPEEVCEQGDFRHRIAGDEGILERAKDGTIFPDDYWASLGILPYTFTLPRSK